tara:strand:+ start:8561 stop:10837 length:2277 start_codon:yes stop_codon:yes gene_type:complete
MAKISTYVIDSTPQLNDKVIGTDVNDNNITKNYTIGDIISLVPPIPSIVTDLFIPISNGVDYVDSVITQDSTTVPTTINVGGLIGITGTGESVFVGKNAGVLSDKTVAQFNVGIGDSALESFTSGINPVTAAAEPGANIALGVGALAKSVQSTNNIAIGIDSLKENTVGFNNVAISKNALGSSVDATTQGMTNNQGSIGIGFSAGNPNLGSELPSGHVNDTIVGHQAMADIFYSAGAAPVQNTVLGMRAFRNIGVSGYGATLEGNVVIGASSGLGIKAGVQSANPGQGDQRNLTASNNVFIGKNAGNNVRSTLISNNIMLGATGNAAKYISRGNVVFETGGAGNQLGNSTTGRTVDDNLIIGSRTAAFTDKNICINPNRYSVSQAQPNQFGTPNIANPNGINAVINNIILGDKASKITNEYSNNKLTFEDPQGLAVSVGNIQGAFIVNSTHTSMLSNNDATMEGNVVINGDSNSFTSNLASTDSNNNRNNYVLGCTNVGLVDSGRNFIFASEFSNPTSFQFNNHNFLFGITSFNGAQQASISNGSDYNFLFNADDVTLSGSSNAVFGQMNATIDGDKNTILNASGTVTGNSNVVLAGTQHTVSGSNNIVSGNSCRTQSSTARSLNIGNNNDIGSSGAANNSVAIGNNIDINSGANNAAFGNGINVTNSTNSFTVGKNNDDSKINTQGNPCLQVGVGQNLNARKNALNIVNASGPLFGVIYMDQLVNQNYANDVDAAAAGIGLGGLYHTNGVVKINITP